MDKQQILKDYLKYKTITVKSNKIEDIEFYVWRWISFNKKKDLKDYDEKDLTDFLNRESKHYATGTLNNIRIYCKNFIKWYFIDWSSRFRNLDKLCKSQTTETAYKPDDMLKKEDFERLIQGEESQFWKAYFLTLFYGGCRPVEVCELKWSNVEFEKEGDGAYITIHSRKNKHDFIKYLPSNVAFYLKKLQNNNSEYVFYNSVTKLPITKKGAYWRIRALSKEVFGKDKVIDLYTLRHSIATILYNKDDIKDDDIAKQMGHTKSMKPKYTHNDKEKIKEKAKRIYLVPEDLPQEKKHKLEQELETMKKILESQDKSISSLVDFLQVLVSKEPKYKALLESIPRY